MEIIQIHPQDKIDKEIVVALGNFDGIHLAHQELIRQAIKIAKKKKLTASVLMFTEHTKKALLHTEQNLLMSRRQKLDLLEKLGIELVVEIEFSEIMKMSPEYFVNEFLAKHLKARAIVVGYDYRFGYKAKGNIDLLLAYAEDLGLDVKVVAAIKKKKNIISSTRIRDEIQKGKMGLANDLLGRPFTIQGRVVHGKSLGKKMGYPTANLQPLAHYVVPKYGVYDTNVLVNGHLYKAATSVGTNPTLKESGLKIEAHILDFDQDIYNQEVDLQFLTFLRKEKSFKNVDELFKQIEKDTNRVRARK